MVSCIDAAPPAKRTLRCRLLPSVAAAPSAASLGAAGAAASCPTRRRTGCRAAHPSVRMLRRPPSAPEAGAPTPPARWSRPRRLGCLPVPLPRIRGSPPWGCLAALPLPLQELLQRSQCRWTCCLRPGGHVATPALAADSGAAWPPVVAMAKHTACQSWSSAAPPQSWAAVRSRAPARRRPRTRLRRPAPATAQSAPGGPGVAAQCG